MVMKSIKLLINSDEISQNASESDEKSRGFGICGLFLIRLPWNFVLIRQNLHLDLH